MELFAVEKANRIIRRSLVSRRRSKKLLTARARKKSRYVRMASARRGVLHGILEIGGRLDPRSRSRESLLSKTGTAATLTRGRDSGRLEASAAVSIGPIGLYAHTAWARKS